MSTTEEARTPGQEPKIDHEFKSHPDVFWPAARGEKTFEYRRDDRGGYEVGQTVRLLCYGPLTGYVDVPPLDRRITNILRGGDFELPKGYCILSLAPLATPRTDSAERTAGEPWLKKADTVIAEMIAVATAEEGSDLADEWPVDLRAQVDLWQASLQGPLGHHDGFPSRPAPSSPGVPDSVRALSEAHDLLRETRDFLSPRPYSTAEADLLRRIKTGISAHPAGQSTKTEMPRVFRDGDAWCCLLGDDLQHGIAGFGPTPRDAVTAFRAHFEPHPAGQSTGQGADEKAYLEQRRDLWLNEAQRLAILVRKLGGDPDAKSAPDSTRTGPVGTEGLPTVEDAIRRLETVRTNARHANKVWLANTAHYAAEWIRALAARPAAPEAQGAWIKVDVQTMRTSAGADYYVRFICGDRSVTPYMFKERYKAEYEAAHFAWVFGLRDEAPDLMAYDETSHPNLPAPPASSGQESAR